MLEENQSATRDYPMTDVRGHQIDEDRKDFVFREVESRGRSPKENPFPSQR